MPVDCQKLFILDTSLGFLGLVFQGSTIVHLSLGYPTRPLLLDAICGTTREGPDRFVVQQNLPKQRSIRRLIDRMHRYTEGEIEEFFDVDLDLSGLSSFQRRVVAMCRRIPYGATATYAEVARRAGSPRAARSVGTVMAKNRVPLLVPCHRVVATGNRLGGFSAQGGKALKYRLLAMEAAARGVPLLIGD